MEASAFKPPSPTPQVALATTAFLSGSMSQATAATGPASGNIVFTPNTSAAVEQGTLQPGQVVTYTLEVFQSQPMTLIMDSPNNDITLGVFEPDGTTLLK